MDEIATPAKVSSDPPPPHTQAKDEGRELSAEELSEVSGGKSATGTGSHSTHNNYAANNSSGSSSSDPKP